jgi:hypothetical protein
MHPKAVPGPPKTETEGKDGAVRVLVDISPFYFSPLIISCVSPPSPLYPALPPPFRMATKAAYKRVRSPIPAFYSFV